MTSGIATRLDLERRRPRTMFHLGPERDRGIFEGLDIALTGIDGAEIALNSGLFDDDVETPDDYKDRLAAMKAKGLLMLCANPTGWCSAAAGWVWCAGGACRRPMRRSAAR